jgi:hypothetical protein
VKPNLIIQLYDSFIQWFIAFLMRFYTKQNLCSSIGFVAYLVHVLAMLILC